MAHNTTMEDPYPVVSNRGKQVAASASQDLMISILADAFDKESNPSGYYNVGIAENVLMHDTLLQYINKQLDLPARYLTYNDGGAGSTRLKTAISRFLNRNLQPTRAIQTDHVIVTNGVSAALEHLSWALTDPGEGILLGRPYYGTFVPDLTTKSAAELVKVSFDECDPFGSAAVQKYEQALLEFQQRTGKKVRALVLCHPHNPLGRCYPKETIVQLMGLCQRYGIHLVSDEIYALSTWENQLDASPPQVKFESVLSIDTTGIIDNRLVHCLWGMSKDFGANGIRIGTIISQANRDLLAALQEVSLYSYVSGLSDHIAAQILEDDQFTTRYLAENSKKLAESFHFAARYVKDRGIEYGQGCNAAFFLWVNLGKKYRELHPETKLMGDDLTEEIMNRLLKHKVFLASGVAFGSELPGWFRIVTSHPVDYLEEALRRIEAAIAE